MRLILLLLLVLKLHRPITHHCSSHLPPHWACGRAGWTAGPAPPPGPPWTPGTAGWPAPSASRCGPPWWSQRRGHTCPAGPPVRSRSPGWRRPCRCSPHHPPGGGCGSCTCWRNRDFLSVHVYSIINTVNFLEKERDTYTVQVCSTAIKHLLSVVNMLHHWCAGLSVFLLAVGNLTCTCHRGSILFSLLFTCVVQSADFLLWSRGFPTRMVHLYYVSCLRYTILVGNPRSAICPLVTVRQVYHSLCCPRQQNIGIRWQDPHTEFLFNKHINTWGQTEEHWCPCAMMYTLHKILYSPCVMSLLCLSNVLIVLGELFFVHYTKSNFSVQRQ